LDIDGGAKGGALSVVEIPTTYFARSIASTGKNWVNLHFTNFF
jgi:hypothetical protein